MANAYFNHAFPNANFGHDNAPNNDGAANDGPAPHHPGQNNLPNNGAAANDYQAPELQQENNIDNAPPADNGQALQVQQRVVVIPPEVMRVWEAGHDIARDNEYRASRGWVRFIHQPTPRWIRALLMFLAEERRAELRRQLAELNEVERVLGLDHM